MVEENLNKNTNLVMKTKALLSIGLLIIFSLAIAGFFYFNNSFSSTIFKNEEQPIEVAKTSTHEVFFNEPKTQIQEATISKNDCLSLKFFRAYLKVKNIAEAGLDYSAEIVSLLKEATPNNIKDNFLELASLAKENSNDNVFYQDFLHLTKEIYLENNNDIISKEFSRDLFFLRKIGKRAIESNGVDKWVISAQNALNDNNLLQAAEYIDKIPDPNNILALFKAKLKSKIRIKMLINLIDEKIIKGEEN